VVVLCALAAWADAKQNIEIWFLFGDVAAHDE
jgi:hypothetical protein